MAKSEEPDGGFVSPPWCITDHDDHGNVELVLSPKMHDGDEMVELWMSHEKAFTVGKSLLAHAYAAAKEVDPDA